MRELPQKHVHQLVGIFDGRSESEPSANHALKISLEQCRRGAEPNRIDEGQNVKLFQMLPLRDILGPRRIAFFPRLLVSLKNRSEIVAVSIAKIAVLVMMTEAPLQAASDQ